MIKMLLAFISLFVIFYTGIEIFRKMTGKERLSVAKTLSYAIGLSVIVIGFMIGIVILF